MRRTRFRFEDLEIWRRGGEITHSLCDIADDLEEGKRYRFAEQLRAAALSIPNNIAEGSGSHSKREFAQFLNIARRSAFECASMLLVFGKRHLVDEERMDSILGELDEESRMLMAFKRSLT